MEKTKNKKQVESKIECSDKLCPIHGTNKVKTRGRVFEGVVIRKLHNRIVIQFERMLKVPKYERYEKRKTKIHARVPDCMDEEVKEGDLVQIAETRPISKTIHAILIKIIGAKK